MGIRSFGTATPSQSYHLDPLALRVPLLERMQVAEIIDRHLLADLQAEFRSGPRLSLLVAARLSQPVALGNVADGAQRCGAERQRLILPRWGVPTPAQLLSRRLLPVPM